MSSRVMSSNGWGWAASAGSNHGPRPAAAYTNVCSRYALSDEEVGEGRVGGYESGVSVRSVRKWVCDLSFFALCPVAGPSLD